MTKRVKRVALKGVLISDFSICGYPRRVAATTDCIYMLNVAYRHYECKIANVILKTLQGISQQSSNNACQPCADAAPQFSQL